MIIGMADELRQIRFPQERHRRMAALLAERGHLTIGELTAHFGVSGPTARRDLSVLSRAGLAARTHGGAMAPGRGTPDEPLFLEKLRLHDAAKARIGRAAAAEVPDGSTVLLDSGTTALATARALAGRDLRVVATDLKVAEAAAAGATRVMLVGGEVRNGYYSIVGAWARAILAGLTCDVLVLAADAIDRDGISNSTAEEAEVKQAAIACAGRTILVADHSKLGRRAPVPVCGLEAVDLFITDRRAASRLDPYRAVVAAIQVV